MHRFLRSLFAGILMAGIPATASAVGGEGTDPLSPACEDLDENPFFDSSYQRAHLVSPRFFEAGELLIVKAGESTRQYSPGPPTVVWIQVDNVRVDTAPFPGTAEYLFPASGNYLIEWGVDSGTVSWQVSCHGFHFVIDIMPGSTRNAVNLDGRTTVISVAVLTTPGFKAARVDPVTVCFGDPEVPAERDCTEAHGIGHPKDVDGDGDTDLLFHFETAQTGIDPGDTQACLFGNTFRPVTSVMDCDSIATT
jgi:hypothetical protein